MNSCSVTKLKSAVENSNLKKLDEIIIEMEGTGTNTLLCAVPFVASITGGNFVINGADAGNAPQNIAANTTFTFGVSSKSKVKINKKYDFLNFTIGGNTSSVIQSGNLDYVGYNNEEITAIRTNSALNAPFDISTLTGKTVRNLQVKGSHGDLTGITITNMLQVVDCPELIGLPTFDNAVTQILVSNIKSKWNATSFNSNTFGNVTTLNVDCVEGNISNFAHFTSAIALRLYGGGIVGTIESLVEAMSPNRSSGTLALTTIDSSITINGNVMDSQNFNIKFEESTVTVKSSDNTITYGTYNKTNNTWTY